MAERALKAVSFRLEQERFNVWVSLMNLEHKYGSRATLKAVMERACQNANPKKVHLHVVEVREKVQKPNGGILRSTLVFFRRLCIGTLYCNTLGKGLLALSLIDQCLFYLFVYLCLVP